QSLIENLMIASNSVTAAFLETRGFPSLRRVVRAPERWDRIRALAAAAGDELPPAPGSAALAAFLARRKAAAPDLFPDLSRTVIRRRAPGESVVDPRGGGGRELSGLAVRDYPHSPARNRRYPDLVTQRLVKAALARHEWPYGVDELARL